MPVLILADSELFALADALPELRALPELAIHNNDLASAVVKIHELLRDLTAYYKIAEEVKKDEIQ